MSLSPLVIATPEIMGDVDVRIKPSTLNLPKTFAEAGMLVRDEIDTLYNHSPESATITDTLDELEFFLLDEAPAPKADAISPHVKHFVTATLEVLVNRGELQPHFAYRFIGTLGLEAAVRHNAALRTQ